MTDLHTHILPGMDDGSKDVEMSLEMLRLEKAQGVDTVVLTPHFYRDMEDPDHFLRRRAVAYSILQERIQLLPESEQERLPKVSIGAEVAWVPNMSHWPELKQLCYEGTNYLLLELPFRQWGSQLMQSINDLNSYGGVIPVIAHIDRYWNKQPKEMVNTLLNFGFPIQISAEAFQSRRESRRALKWLRDGKASLLISDCHNMNSRPPNLALAMETVIKKMGESADTLFSQTDALLRSRANKPARKQNTNS